MPPGASVAPPRASRVPGLAGSPAPLGLFSRAARRCRRPLVPSPARRPSARARAVAASGADPLSAAERAELDLRRRAEAVRARLARREDEAAAAERARPYRPWKTKQDDDSIYDLTPEESEVLAQTPEYWAARDRLRDAAFDRTVYGDVLSEFAASVDVAATRETCHRVWRDPAALRRFVPGLERCDPAPDGVCVEAELYYLPFGDARLHELQTLRFMAHRARDEPGVAIHWQSTDGFPCGVNAAFRDADAAADGGGEGGGILTTVELEFYCHLPKALAEREGVMKVALDVEERIAECLGAFATLAEATEMSHGEAGGEGEEDVAWVAAGVAPEGFGLVGADGEPVARDRPTKVSRRAMERAARAFEERAGRKPLTVEVLREMGKATR